MLVRSRMTREVIVASPSMSVAEAIAVTRQHRIRHLPVVQDGRLVGVASDRDLRLAIPPQGSMPDAERRELMDRTRVGDVMVKEVITVTPDAPVEEAAALLAENKIGCLPVLSDGRLVGILSETDVLHAFVELFRAHGPSTRIEIRMPDRPGELARVVRLIGVDFKINITGMVIPPLSDGEALAIVHLQTLDPRDLIEALEKLGYEVGWPSLG